jgi:hypothetical protein
MRIFPTHRHQWLSSCPGHFNPGKEGWVVPRAGLDILERRKIFCPYQDFEPRTIKLVELSLYCPCFPVHKTDKKIIKKAKINFTLQQAIKACRGSIGRALHSL